MHETEATITTSRRLNSDEVAARRRRSISSLICESFLDVGVGARQIGFGLVVVVVADEVLDRVVREELLELAVKLRGQGLVVRHDQRRPVDRLDDPAMM